MTLRIVNTDRITVVRARLRRMDALDTALKAKRAAIMAKRKITGKDAARYVTLSQALNRLDVLHPLHRVRYLPG